MKYSFFCRCNTMVRWHQLRTCFLNLKNVNQYFPWTLDGSVFENKPGLPSLHGALGLKLVDFADLATMTVFKRVLRRV